jgi:tetraacyldisaccharide-1-P 4'-kinase
VTTEKDAMRLAHDSPVSQALLQKCFVFKIEMRFDQPDAPTRMIEATVAKFKERQLGLR